jgi:hypothetical protein
MSKKLHVTRGNAVAYTLLLAFAGQEVTMTETSIVPVPSSVRSADPLWPKAVIAFGVAINIAWVCLLGYWAAQLIEMAL